MKRSDELKQKRAGLLEEIQPLTQKAELNAEEQKAFDTKSAEVEQLDAAIADAERKEAFAKRAAELGGNYINKNDGEQKELKNYSFVKAIRMATGLDEKSGLEYELHQDEKKRRDSFGLETNGIVVPERLLRNQVVGTPTSGGNMVQDEPMYFYDELEAKLDLVQLGAHFITGLKGNLPMGSLGTFTAAWLTETESLTIGTATSSKDTATPKRVAAGALLSKQWLTQTSMDVEKLVKDRLLNALAIALQTAAISGSGSGANPKGILNISGIGSVVAGDPDGAALTWADIVDLKTEVAKKNALIGAKLGYVTNSNVVGFMQQTLKNSGVAGFMMENGMVNGYKTVESNLVPSNLTKGAGTNLSAMIFGAWEYLMMLLWGGLDLTTDPFTKLDTAQIRIIANQFADVQVEQPEYFAAIKDINA